MDSTLSSSPPPRPRAKKKHAPTVFKLRRISATFGGPICSPTSSTHSSLTPPASPIHTTNPPSPLSPRPPPRRRRLSIASSHEPLDEYPLQTATFGPSNYQLPATPTTSTYPFHRRRSDYYPQPQDTVQREPFQLRDEENKVEEREDDDNEGDKEGDGLYSVEVLLQEQPLELPTRPLVHTPAIWTSSISALEERQEEEDEASNSLFANLTGSGHVRSSSLSSLSSSSSPWSPSSPRVLTPPHTASRPASPTQPTFSHAANTSPLITARTSSLTSASMSLLSLSPPNSQQQQPLCRKSSATSTKSQALSLHSIKAFVLGTNNSHGNSSNSNNSSSSSSNSTSNNSCTLTHGGVSGSLSPTTLSPYTFTANSPVPAALANTAQQPKSSRHKKTPSAVSAASFFSSLSLTSSSSSSFSTSPPSSRASTPRPKKGSSRNRTPPMLLPPLSMSMTMATHTGTVPTNTTTTCCPTSSSAVHLSPTSPTPIPIPVPTSPVALSSPAALSPISTMSRWTNAEDPLIGSYPDHHIHHHHHNVPAPAQAHSYANDFNDFTNKHDTLMLTTFTSNSTSSTLTPSSFPMSDLGSLTPTPTNSSITANAAASAKARGKKSRHRSECKFCSFFRIC